MRASLCQARDRSQRAGNSLGGRGVWCPARGLPSDEERVGFGWAHDLESGNPPTHSLALGTRRPSGPSGDEEHRQRVPAGQSPSRAACSLVSACRSAAGCASRAPRRPAAFNLAPREPPFPRSAANPRPFQQPLEPLPLSTGRLYEDCLYEDGMPSARRWLRRRPVQRQAVCAKMGWRQRALRT